MTFIRKTQEEKDKEKAEKQSNMIKLESNYEKLLANKVQPKKDIILSKHSKAKTLYQGWLYGIYISIVDVQNIEEKSGRLFYIFENIPEAKNKYKLAYSVDENSHCAFKISALEKLPKDYNKLLKRNSFNFNQETSSVAELIAAHSYKLDDSAYIHHADYNKLNNEIKNIIPLEREFFDSLSLEQKNNFANASKHIPEKYLLNITKKAKDVIKMDYRACDLYYNHKIEPDKIAKTLRNRLNKASVLRIVKLYPHFKELYN